MYYQVIAQRTQSLKNLETCGEREGGAIRCLGKADRYAATKEFDTLACS
jgi:hypothetical protein